uniref:Uncharacterized protein n=1 Tax=Chromera velia CCMP2878 TaxID=1169474 RepID=A0A0K6S6M2_9ALVE|eukprot:Cvel_17637.t2-p1 / transcript=Cvel_17637.t2 / gene=Cvel_17637 / organism=Chromera_velia_CCMP2878 / gene_product=hypothetical protein / transcript_product=hypothetical protein / location=Cvel_scaffold1420:32979-33772(+) / protein_length=230 / sequence_SO=supercontig / SO=protein_coding / is_pseudo=false
MIAGSWREASLCAADISDHEFLLATSKTFDENLSLPAGSFTQQRIALLLSSASVECTALPLETEVESLWGGSAGFCESHEPSESWENTDSAALCVDSALTFAPSCGLQSELRLPTLVNGTTSRGRRQLSPLSVLVVSTCPTVLQRVLTDATKFGLSYFRGRPEDLNSEALLFSSPGICVFDLNRFTPQSKKKLAQTIRRQEVGMIRGSRHPVPVDTAFWGTLVLSDILSV